MRFTRRAVVASALLMPAVAYAQQVRLDAPWHQARGTAQTMLAAEVRPLGGQPQTLSAWLQGRPTILTVFATWCPPCMAEKPLESALNERLVAASSRTQIRSLLAFDRIDIAAARARLQTIGAGSLDLARASDQAELGALHVFGFDRSHGSAISATRPSLSEIAARLPLTIVLDSSGRVLGDAIGMVKTADGQASYWEDDAAFDVLRNLP